MPARADEHISHLNRLAQVVQVTPEIAKTAARLEAKYGVQNSGFGPKLTRWDSIHLATAIVYRCSRFLTLDEDLLDTNFSTESFMPHLVKPTPLQQGLRFQRPPANSSSS
jgi:predicted nucleic acid-binding protein